MRLLLHVENDPLVARAVKRLLQIHQYEVATVPSYEQGMATSGGFHAGVIDIDLGDGDGVALAKSLLDRNVIRHAVFFTARTDQETTERASAVGRVVSKTAGIDALLGAVAECFRLRMTTSQTCSRVDEDSHGEGEPDREALPRSSSRSA